jgi:hypothetical protein
VNYATLRSSESIGSHFMRHVRNAFEAEKIGDEAALAQAERKAQLHTAAAHRQLNAMINRAGRVYVSI